MFCGLRVSRLRVPWQPGTIVARGRGYRLWRVLCGHTQSSLQQITGGHSTFVLRGFLSDEGELGVFGAGWQIRVGCVPQVLHRSISPPPTPREKERGDFAVGNRWKQCFARPGDAWLIWCYGFMHLMHVMHAKRDRVPPAPLPHSP